MSYEPQDTDSVESEKQGFVVTTQADLLQIFDLIKTTSRVEGAIESAIQSVPEAQRTLIKASLAPMIEDMGASVLDLQKLFLSQLPSIDDMLAMYGGQSENADTTVGATSAYVPQDVADDEPNATHNGFTSNADNEPNVPVYAVDETSDIIHEGDVDDLGSLLDDTLDSEPVYQDDADDKQADDEPVNDMKSMLDDTFDSDPVEVSIADNDDYLDELNSQESNNTVVATEDEFLADLEESEDTHVSDDMVLTNVTRTELPTQNSMSAYNELVAEADISAKHHLPDLTAPIDDATLDGVDDVASDDDAENGYNVETDEFGEPLEADGDFEESLSEDNYDGAEFSEPTEEDDFEDGEFGEPIEEDDYDSAIDTNDNATDDSQSVGFSVPPSNN